MNKKIFIFWQGPTNTELMNKIHYIKQNSDFEVILGPSKVEDEYLSKNFAYYKLAKEKKVYPFMSDVWRFWLQKNNFGIYMDAGCIVGKDFFKISNELFKNNIDTIIKENTHLVLSGFFFFTKRSPLFSNCLEWYEKTGKYSKNNLYLFDFSPTVLLLSLLKLNYIKPISYFHKNLRKTEKELIIFDASYATFLNGKNFIARSGYGAWGNNNNSAKTLLHARNLQQNFDAFIKKSSNLKIFFDKLTLKNDILWKIFYMLSFVVPSTLFKNKIKNINKRLINRKIINNEFRGVDHH